MKLSKRGEYALRALIDLGIASVRLGGLTGREDARLDTVLASANDAHAALVKIKPFWR